MDERIRERRERRAEFLRRLYVRVDGSVSEFIAADEIAQELGLDGAEARRVFEYFEEKGFVKVDDHREGILRITAAGIDEVESRLA
jgi:predicted ArsR family transcriptional regulator